LAPSVEVISLQYPGRQDRRADPCLDSVGAFADHVADALRPLTDLPLIFFGHSLGATIAYETARRLAAAGTEISALFASGRRGPSVTRDERVHLKSDAELLGEVRELDGTNGTLLEDDEFVQLILPALRADYRAAETYRHQPGAELHCPITTMIGDEDPKVTAEEAKAWQEHTTGKFELMVFPGGHFYLNHHQAEILRAITAHLDGVAVH
jgi:surfactin synthase thioesterase subunit